MQAIPHNLPLQLSSFIGRERELAEVGRLLAASRLVTLTGAGGSGKTRLALQVGAQVAERFAQGVWLVDLAALSDPLLVPQRLASALDVPEQPGRPLVATLIDALREREALLVLDNCEHLIDACAQLTDALLHACAPIRILATSREALNLAGEQVYLVPALSLPASGALVAKLAESEAAQLFVSRAAGAQTHFALNAENAEAVAQICRRLDGIPLAIELAAARVKTLTPQQIAARLDDSFRWLGGGTRTALPRHRTLDAAIAWSYELLPEAERVAMRRLAVFAGGWTLEAAESVAGEEGAAPGAMVECLSQLVNKSLVSVEAQDGESRYRFLETVRQYALEKLEASGEATRQRDQQLAFFLQFGEATQAKLYGPEQLRWYRRLDSEHDNLRAALTWSLEAGAIEQGLRLAAALLPFWFTRGYWKEGRERLDGLLARAEGVGLAQSPSRAGALLTAGVLAQTAGDLKPSYPLLQESVALARRWGASGLLGRALLMFGRSMMEQDLAAARALAEESLAVGLAINDEWCIGHASHHLGNIAYNAGDNATARTRYEEAIAVYKAMGDRLSYSLSLASLGDVLGREGRYAASRTAKEESLVILREAGDRRHIANVLATLGTLEREQGNYEAARAYYQESFQIRREMGSNQFIAYSLENFARLAASLNQLERAVRLFAAADVLMETVGVPIWVYFDVEERQRLMDAVRGEMSAAAFDAAWKQGRALSTEEAVRETEQVTTTKAAVTAPAVTTYPAGLSAREVEVLRLVAMGLTNPEIAAQLVISNRTVDAHLRSIYGKLDVTTRSAATRVAVEYGVV